MTALCAIRQVQPQSRESHELNIHLQAFYESMEVEPHDTETPIYPNIVSIQYANNEVKGSLTKKRKKNRTKKPTKRNSFQNQITFVIEIENSRHINLKLFRNGKIQMTGLKTDADGYRATELLMQKIMDHREDLIAQKVMDLSMTVELELQDFKIVLINSDFSTHFSIKRDKLYSILIKMGIWVSYEPDIYPGVNTKYYWNETHSNHLCPHPAAAAQVSHRVCIDPTNTNNYIVGGESGVVEREPVLQEKEGVCRCIKSCLGNGLGYEDGDCRKVTIAIFKSGNIIITGARTKQQSYDAYLLSTWFCINTKKLSVETLLKIT